MRPEDAITVLTEMALSNKVDYAVVRGLAQAFSMTLPPTIREVVKNLEDLRFRRTF